jgi:O-antigen/teichoic acid export membrane protein
MSGAAQRLLSGRVLAANTVWTLAGFLLPALVGLAAMPAIIRGFGDERFGVLTLAWMVIGYFSLFDLGLGRAVTRRVSELLVSPDRSQVGQVLWTGWYLMLALGLAGAVVGALLVPILIDVAVPVSPALHGETVTSFYLLVLAVPVIVLSAGISGTLQAAQRFGLVNAVRIPSGLLTFLVPLVMLRFTTELPPTVAALIVVRVVVLAAYATMCFRTIDGVRSPARFDRNVARELLGFGGWLTVSNVISPVMQSFDRFFVSALVSVAAVTYYATPAEAVSKAYFIPSAVAAVLFPAFSAANAADRQRMGRLFRAGLRTVLLVQLPLALAVIWFAPDILRFWLGPAFELRSTGVMRWLMLGVLINSLAFLPFTLLQGLGRADLTGKLHLVELPLYLALLVPLIQRYGIDGAAVAWCLRVTADLAALFWLASRVAGESGASLFAADRGGDWRRSVRTLLRQDRRHRPEQDLEVVTETPALHVIELDVRADRVGDSAASVDLPSPREARP